MPITDSLRTAWRAFRRPGRLFTLAAAVLVVLAYGLLFAFGNHQSCAGPCQPLPQSADGAPVNDQFWFLHRDLGRDGEITARLTAMTGTITYPPPNHDQIVPGLVPWAKAGLIVKDGVRPGSQYAALMRTGSHGVHFQSGYTNDVAAAGTGPWLRLTRAGNTITGAESADGQRWTPVATVVLDGLPDTVQVGLFATSPGDLSLRETGLGGATEQVRFTQAAGTFDTVTVRGGAAGLWRSEPVGEMNQTDWEKYHQPSGAVERAGVVTVSGTGDIGPRTAGPDSPQKALPGLTIAVLLVLVAAARFGARSERPELAARGTVVAAAGFGTGLLSVGILLPISRAILRGNGIPVAPIPLWTMTGLVAGIAAALALCAVFAFGLGAWLRRGWLASAVATLLVAVPYVVTTFPLLPDPIADWLLRLTPAAGFSAAQTAVEYPQVTAHYAASAGYFPLPGWAGLLVLGGFAALASVAAASRRNGSRSASPTPPAAAVPAESSAPPPPPAVPR
ncbi:hypothetical protein [Amycolatopsis benzoatilytica]|uniref:hypothetical protein n=1 Tax=Amycolatopsis benzoatilytica TaxID=346045 RepID=UPI0003690A5D|nr:hypothetical protein [Amycolatopsis benzoatilytica]